MQRSIALHISLIFGVDIKVDDIDMVTVKASYCDERIGSLQLGLFSRVRRY